MTETNPSRWWYGIAAPVALLLLGWLAWAGVRLTTSGVPGTDPTQLVPRGNGSLLFLLGAFVAVVTTWVSAPVFAVSLFMDSRAVRRSDFEWEPNHYLYGGVGLLHLGALFTVVVYVVTMPAALFYLYRRHQRVGTP